MASPLGMQSRRGLFFNWGLVMIAILTLSAAFLLLAAKEERVSEQAKIGERQFGLYGAYQDGEEVLDTLDGVGKRSAERAVHDLALAGGYTEESIAASACAQKRTAHGTPVWVDRETECFPENYTLGFMALYDRSISDYFGAGALPFGKPGYAHFLEFEGSKDRPMEVLSRSLDNAVLNLSDRSQYYLKEGDFDPNRVEAFSDHIHEIEYGGRDTTAYYVDVPAASSILIDIGEWIPPLTGLYSGECSYCGTNKQLLQQYYPDEFASEGCTLGWLQEPRCCFATCPPGTILVETVPYYSQSSIPDPDDSYNFPGSGCGPTSMLMALEGASLGAQDPYEIWRGVHADPEDGTGVGGISTYAQGKGVLGGTGTDMLLDQLGGNIEIGNSVIMNVYMIYDDQKGCLDCSSGGGHYITVVGISANEVIINDPFMPWSVRTPHPLAGQHLVITQAKYGEMTVGSDKGWYAIIDSALPQTASSSAEPDILPGRRTVE